MIVAARTNVRKVLKFYLIPGFVLGGIKLASIVAWFLAAPIGLVGSNYVAGDFLGILLMSFGGVVLEVVGWPIVLFNLLSGTASLAVVLFFAWVTHL